MTIPTVRVRARKPKTRTGCRTCKIRRVKCDEQWPSCQKCFSSGRQCDGYELGSATRSTISNISSARHVMPKVLIVAPHANRGLDMTSDEFQGWDFFRTKTASEIRGCFRSDLWEYLILQISHQEPSILHAAIAVGSMHRKYKESGVSNDVSDLQDPCRVFSLRQYVKAIGSLRTRLQDTGAARTKEVSLITCLLFICLEMLQGRRIEALTHMQTGLRILSSPAAQTKGSEALEPKQLVLKHDPETTMDQLTSVFARLDYESTWFGVQSPSLHLIPQQNEKKSPIWVPAIFFNTQEARQYMDILSSTAFRLRGELLETAKASIPDPNLDIASIVLWKEAIARSLDLSSHPNLLNRLRELQASLAVWLSALEALKHRAKALFSNEDTRAVIVVEIQHFYISFTMATCQTTKEMSCDSFNDDFKRVLSLADSYVRGAAHGTSNLEPRVPSFTLDSGVIPSLYLVATKCRHPVMRRQAISMMYHAECQEGMWEGPLIARFVEQIVDFEETAAGSMDEITTSANIPEAARMSDVVLCISESPGYGRLICGRYRHEMDGELHVWEEMFLLKR